MQQHGYKESGEEFGGAEHPNLFSEISEVLSEGFDDYPEKAKDCLDSKDVPLANDSTIAEFSFQEVLHSSRSWYYHTSQLNSFIRAPALHISLGNIFREHFRQTFYSLNFCKQLLPFSEQELFSKTRFLPPRKQ